MSAASIPACLASAGLLGHTWFVTVKAQDGSERLLLQGNSPADAVRHFDEAGDKAVAIYTKTKRGFKRVSYTLAVIS